ncbi:MAG TPA: SCO family protein [Sphingomicrobium sp.]
MTDDARPPRRNLKQVRTLLWILVALASAGTVALFLLPQVKSGSPAVVATEAQSGFGGPFTLVGADGQPFSSARLAGKPYAIYFGFTRCGDVCPVTLGRLVKLRKEAGGDDKLNIIFVTIDPANDGPKEVGQYAGAFNAPIIGLTGSQAQIDRVKKQYGIFAEPSPHSMPGKEMEHTATVLLFDRDGALAGTITTDEGDGPALDKIRRVTA